MTDESLPVCGFDVGDNLPCRCLLPRGHTVIHQCQHSLGLVKSKSVA